MLFRARQEKPTRDTECDQVKGLPGLAPDICGLITGLLQISSPAIAGRREGPLKRSLIDVLNAAKDFILALTKVVLAVSKLWEVARHFT